MWCAGLAYVCEGLKEQRKGLVTLVLWNNQLTHNGMGYLAAALVNTRHKMRRLGSALMCTRSHAHMSCSHGVEETVVCVCSLDSAD